MVTPDILHQFGIIDERVTVALLGLNTVVAIYLFLRNRILAVPLQKKCHAVACQTIVVRCIVRGIEYLRAFGSCELLVIAICPSYHRTEIAACKVTFVLVHRFEDL